MNAEQVKKASAVIGVVQGTVDLLVAALAEAGVGGHLNLEQDVRVLDLFSNLAKKALDAYATAHGVEITAESIQALFVDDAPLPPADEPGTEGALLNGNASIPSVDNPASSASAPSAEVVAQDSSAAGS